MTRVACSLIESICRWLTDVFEMTNRRSGILVPKELMLSPGVSRFDRDEKKIIFVGSFVHDDQHSSSGGKLAVCICFYVAANRAFSA